METVISDEILRLTTTAERPYRSRFLLEKLAWLTVLQKKCIIMTLARGAGRKGETKRMLKLNSNYGVEKGDLMAAECGHSGLPSRQSAPPPHVGPHMHIG